LELVAIADLQIGQETYFANMGLFIPQFQTKIMIENIIDILKKTKAKRLLINGDFKHDFSLAAKQEWNDVSKFIEEISKYVKTIIVVKGNHDNYLQTILGRFKIRIVDEALIDDYLFIHGHNLPKTDEKKYNNLIIGHEQPGVVLRTGFEKFKLPCFLYGETLDKKQFIAMPSFSPLSSNSEINLQEKKDLLSPILRSLVDLNALKVIAIDRDAGILRLPEIGKLKSLENSL
jgi:putative SbcD/Mre11-related phosphoesterase